MYLDIEGTTEENVVRNRNTVKLTRLALKSERSDLDMIAVVPWCKNEDDEKRDVERHAGETVLMDMGKTATEKLETEEYVTRTIKNVFNPTAICSGCVSSIRGTARQAHTESGRQQR